MDKEQFEINLYEEFDKTFEHEMLEDIVNRVLKCLPKEDTTDCITC